MTLELAELKACVGEVFNECLAKMQEASDPTRPLTAAELLARWEIAGETQKAKLGNLAKRCAAWGLRPLRGTRGLEALYNRADVVHAESFASGKINRRKHAA